MLQTVYSDFHLMWVYWKRTLLGKMILTLLLA